jgi:hypothetical protein
MMGSRSSRHLPFWSLFSVFEFVSVSLAFENSKILIGGVFQASLHPEEHLSGSTIIVFEASEYGVGALVLNRPTPISVGQLGGSMRLETFQDNLLYAGGAFGESNTILAEMSPWYWLHPYDSVPKSLQLSSCAYMGGDTDTLSKVAASCPTSLRFFWRHTAFSPGSFEQQVNDQVWTRLPDDAWMSV